MDTVEPSVIPIDEAGSVVNISSGHSQPLETPLMWPKDHSGAIAFVDGVFEENFCNNLIQWCLDNPDRSKRGLTMGGIKLDTKVSTDWNVSAEGDLLEQEFDARLFEGLWRVVHVYHKTFRHLQDPEHINTFATGDTGYQIQRYEQKQGFYTTHIDGSPWTTSASFRTLGAIIYLNTVDNGGGTVFPLHNVTIDAVAGRVALFPAYWTHPHGGLIPLSSEKWIVSSFIEAIPRSECTCDGEDHEH